MTWSVQYWYQYIFNIVFSVIFSTSPYIVPIFSIMLFSKSWSSRIKLLAMKLGFNIFISTKAVLGCCTRVSVPHCSTPFSSPSPVGGIRQGFYFTRSAVRTLTVTQVKTCFCFFFLFYYLWARQRKQFGILLANKHLFIRGGEDKQTHKKQTEVPLVPQCAGFTIYLSPPAPIWTGVTMCVGVCVWIGVHII